MCGAKTIYSDCAVKLTFDLHVVTKIVSHVAIGARFHQEEHGSSVLPSILVMPFPLRRAFGRLLAGL